MDRESEYSDDADGDDWRQRSWRQLTARMACLHPYDRRKFPYRQFVPQVPFYMHLALSMRPSKKGGALRVKLPDTVIFGLGPDPGSNGVTKAWLYNSPDGYVCRREHFTDQDILDRFRNEEPRAIVAVMKRPNIPGGVGGEHQPGDGTQVLLLNTEDLAETLYNRESFGLFCIQAFVPPRKGRCFLARSIWRIEGGGSGFTHDCYFTTAKKSFLETGSLGDLLLDLEVPGSADITQVKGAVTEDLEQRTASVKTYMERSLAPAINVLELVCDYTKDSQGRWWLLQVKAFKLEKSKREKANTILRGIDLLKAKGLGQEVEVAFSIPESQEPAWVKGKVIAIRMEKVTVQFPVSSRTEDVSTADFGRLWRVPRRRVHGSGPPAEEISTSREDIKLLSRAPAQQSLKQSNTKLHLAGFNRPMSAIDWNGYTLKRTPTVYRNNSIPPSLPGQKLGPLDSDAMHACKWCGTRCRSSHLSCTLSRKMIADVQIHMKRRGVVFSWFERTDILLTSMSDKATLSGSTASKQTPMRVCHTCYEIYVTEMKLIKAETLYAAEIGLPIADPTELLAPTESTQDLKNIVVEEQRHVAEEPVEGNLKCFRFMLLFGEIEALPVPLLFETPNLCLKYTFMGVTTTLPLSIDASTLQRKLRLPRSHSEPEPENEPEQETEPNPEAEAEAEAEAEPEPQSEEQRLAARVEVATAMMNEAAERLKKLETELEQAKKVARDTGATVEPAVAASFDAAKEEFELSRKAAQEAAAEMAQNAEQRIKKAEALIHSGGGTGEAQLEAHRILEEANNQLESSRAQAKAATELTPIKVGKGDTEIRVRRSLFAQDAERKRREKQEAEEAQRRREAAMAGAEERRRAEKAAKRAEERRKAEEAIARTEAAKKEREEALAAEAERKRQEEEEMRRLKEEQERIANEPTFSIATVPINKLRPFYLFAANSHRVLKPFFNKLEVVNVTLCGGRDSGKKVLAETTIPLVHLVERKEFMVHFHADGLGDTFVRVTMGLSRIDGVAPQHLPLKLFSKGIHGGVYTCTDLGFSPSCPLPHGWLSSLHNKLASETEEEAAARASAHDIARHELGLEKEARRQLEDMQRAAAQASATEMQLLKEAESFAENPSGSAVSSPSTGAHFTKVSTLSKKLYKDAMEMEEMAKMAAASDEANKPCFWRAVVELLHVAGFGVNGRQKFGGDLPAPIAVEVRLFGETIMTSLTLPSPPITLLDHTHTIYIKARKSNLRRYFFASPRAHIKLLQEESESDDTSSTLTPTFSTVGSGTLDIQPLLKKGFFEADVSIPIPNHARAASQVAKVHIALWLERLDPAENPSNYITIKGY